MATDLLTESGIRSYESMPEGMTFVTGVDEGAS